MIVTRVEEFGKNRSKVYIDEQLAFVLYRGELSCYKIKENKEIGQEVYDEIVREVLLKRAKLRCLYLLKSQDRTEQQLRQKLCQGNYPAVVVNQAIDYVKSYGYIDDLRYSQQYMEYRESSKSRRQIMQELLRKGISKEIIQAVFEKKEPVDESALIYKWIAKKCVDLENATFQERQKLYLFLLRKGFSSNEINRAIKGVGDFD